MRLIVGAWQTEEDLATPIGREIIKVIYETNSSRKTS
jgi:hypothetical protein